MAKRLNMARELNFDDDQTELPINEDYDLADELQSADRIANMLDLVALTDLDY